MAKWGSADFEQLKQFRKNLDKLQRVDLDKFCRETSKDLAARLLSLVIPRTPVGEYPNASGKKGGTLRRGWTAKSHDEAASGGGKTDAKTYASTLPITKSGNSYTIEVINPVEYASYVEFGHRTPGGNGWVRGQYFLTLSEQDLERIAPTILERKLEALLREVFSG